MILRIPRKRRIDSMLSLYRRHTKKCGHRSKGARWIKCHCPVWAWGELPNRQWIRKATGTTSMSQARRTIEVWEREQNTDAPPSIDFAADAFLEQHKGDADATREKYSKIMRLLRLRYEHRRCHADSARSRGDRDGVVAFCRHQNTRAFFPQMRRVYPSLRAVSLRDVWSRRHPVEASGNFGPSPF